MSPIYCDDFDNYNMIYKCANFLANLFRCYDRFQITYVLVYYYDDWLYYMIIFREGFKYYIIDNFKKKVI